MAFKTFFSKKEEEKKKNSATQAQAQAQVPTASEEKPSNHAEVKSSPPLQTNEEPPVAVQLENAILENARQDTQDSRSRVYQELLFSDLLLALVDGPAPQPVSSSPDTPQNLNVAIMSNPQGVQFAAVFTGAEAAKRWRVEGGQYVAIRGQDIFKLLEPSPADVIAVNPGSVPFVTLSKAEYRSLAQGVVPQTAKSPVQATAGPAANQQEMGMQISFPPDAFTEKQKESIQQILSRIDNIEAAALGALLPPNAPDENSWLRTVFLRTKEVQKNQQDIQKYCIEIRDQIIKNSAHFADAPFEVGVMPDANFWIAINQNNFILYDKNPPKAPPAVTPMGARKA